MFIRRKTRLNTDVFNALQMFSSVERIQKWTTIIPAHIDQVNENLVIWSFEDFKLKGTLFEFHLMQCTQSTEYCTEIHVLLRADDSADESSINQAETILEDIRFKVNRSWIIEDKDLNSSLLKSR